MSLRYVYGPVKLVGLTLNTPYGPRTDPLFVSRYGVYDPVYGNSLILRGYFYPDDRNIGIIPAFVQLFLSSKNGTLNIHVGTYTLDGHTELQYENIPFTRDQFNQIINTLPDAQRDVDIGTLRPVYESITFPGLRLDTPYGIIQNPTFSIDDISNYSIDSGRLSIQTHLNNISELLVDMILIGNTLHTKYTWDSGTLTTTSPYTREQYEGAIFSTEQPRVGLSRIHARKMLHSYR